MDFLYTMKEVCARTGLSYETLKYYCREELIPDLQRDRNNRRLFSAEDLAQTQKLVTLRACHMSIEQMRLFLQLEKRGRASLSQRLQLLRDKEQEIREEAEQLEKTLACLQEQQEICLHELAAETDK